MAQSLYSIAYNDSNGVQAPSRSPHFGGRPGIAGHLRPSPRFASRTGRSTCGCKPTAFALRSPRIAGAVWHPRRVGHIGILGVASVRYLGHIATIGLFGVASVRCLGHIGTIGVASVRCAGRISTICLRSAGCSVRCVDHIRAIDLLCVG
jgi:hypothetical protein